MRSLYAALIALLFIACDNKNKSTNYGAVGLEPGDPTFLALKDTAQSKLSTFIDSLAVHGRDTNYTFIVKSDFVENGEHEHMWSTVYEYKNETFMGFFADSAYTLKNIKQGDEVLIKKEDIEDWVIYDNLHNLETGNFSDKYLRSKDQE